MWIERSENLSVFAQSYWKSRLKLVCCFITRYTRDTTRSGYLSTYHAPSSGIPCVKIWSELLFLFSVSLYNSLSEAQTIPYHPAITHHNVIIWESWKTLPRSIFLIGLNCPRQFVIILVFSRITSYWRVCVICFWIKFLSYQWSHQITEINCASFRSKLVFGLAFYAYLPTFLESIFRGHTIFQHLNGNGKLLQLKLKVNRFMPWLDEERIF